MSDVLSGGGLPTLRIEGKIEEAKRHLEEIGYPVKGIAKKLLAVVARAARNRVRTNMGAYLRLGHAARSLKSGKLKSLASLSLRNRVYGYARSESHWVVAAPRYIAEPLERGAVIEPRKGKLLSFQGDEGFRRAKQVRIPARHWFTRSLGDFENSAEVDKAIDDAVTKWVEKWERGSADRGTEA